MAWERSGSPQRCKRGRPKDGLTLARALKRHEVLEQLVELATCGRWRGDRECELSLGSSEGTSSSHELVAKCTESAKGEDGRTGRHGRAAFGVGLELRLAAEVVREHRRQHVDLVGDQALARDVAERRVLLRLAEDLLLNPAPVWQPTGGPSCEGQRGSCHV